MLIFALAAISHMLFCMLVPTISHGMIVNSYEPPSYGAVRDDFQLLRLLANLAAAKCGARCQLISDHRRVKLALFVRRLVFRPFQSRAGAAVEGKRWGGSRFQQNGNRSNMSNMSGDLGGSGAAACSGSSGDYDNVVLRVGDPRTSAYCFLSGGADGLPAASQLVSARLGIDGALSMRHLCLWTFLLSSG